MGFGKQATLGVAMLMASAAGHVVVLISAASALAAAAEATAGWSGLPRAVALTTAAVLVVVVGHTLQIATWAAAFRVVGAIERFEDAAYFTLVTTSTLGYGDLTLPRRFRLFGAVAAVSGLITFGLSTAYLISVLELTLAPGSTGLSPAALTSGGAETAAPGARR